MGLVIPRTCQALSLLDDFALLLPLPVNSKETIKFLQDKDDNEIIQRARAWGSGHREEPRDLGRGQIMNVPECLLSSGQPRKVVCAGQGWTPLRYKVSGVPKNSVIKICNILT